ncbi:FAD-dependent oxidoreductase [bacterium]|nr:FAD-dependent oxidoreductase [bacterium]
MKNELYDLIIIGGGPAGITAGIYAGRQHLKTLLISKEFGGQVAKKAVDIENYPGFEKISGIELIQKFKNHLQKFNIEVQYDEVTKIQKEENVFGVHTKTGKTFNSLAVIIASGADPRPLEVEGEKEFLGKGVSYCAVCDGSFFKDKVVAVVGGGNAGFETAIFLSKIAKKIYILEYGETVKADQTNQEIVKRSGKTEIITNAQVKKIFGKEKVEGVIYLDRKTQEEKELKVDGVFIQIGNQPATSFAKDLVDFNERDEIVVEFETCQTKTAGLFAAGDCNTGPFKQIVTACGEGAKSALAAFQYIQKLKSSQFSENSSR